MYHCEINFNGLVSGTKDFSFFSISPPTKHIEDFGNYINFEFFKIFIMFVFLCWKTFQCLHRFFFGARIFYSIKFIEFGI